MFDHLTHLSKFLLSLFCCCLCCCATSGYSIKFSFAVYTTPGVSLDCTHDLCGPMQILTATLAPCLPEPPSITRECPSVLQPPPRTWRKLMASPQVRLGSQGSGRHAHIQLTVVLCFPFIHNFWGAHGAPAVWQTDNSCSFPAVHSMQILSTDSSHQVLFISCRLPALQHTNQL